MNQGARTRTLTKMRRGGIRVLVATDVAARGLDVPGISHVINFDLPKFAEDYVHRIGRTGRAGASGIAVSFASHKDMQHLQRIERFTGQAIAPHTSAGFEPKRVPRAGGAPRSGQERKFSGKPAGSRSFTGQPRREGGFGSGEKRPNAGGFGHHNGRRHG
jgi:superfamily II DNA/RNA helicase